MNYPSKYKIPFIIVHFFICSYFIFSCNNANNSELQKVFHLNLVGGLESLDPAFAKDLSSMWCAHAIYNTLVETDENLHLVPSLAKRWEVSTD